MGRRIGVICGAGTFPRLAVAEVCRLSGDCVVAGIRNQADPGLSRGPYPFEWFEAGELSRLISYFAAHHINQAVMVGKINPTLIYRPEAWDESSRRLIEAAGARSPAALLGLVIQHLSERGIEIISPAFLLEPYFCRPGIMTSAVLSPAAEAAIAFGMKAARIMADLDIGQTVVVKDGVVAAVEGLEGTDEAVRRGGKLAGPGTVVVKVGRTDQDMIIDVPAVGLETLKAMAESGAAILAIEAGRVAFFQQEEAIALAESRGITVVAKTP